MTQPTLLRSSVTLLALCLLSAPAWAGTGLDKWLGHASEVVIADIVDVPLYGAPNGSAKPCVMVTIDGKPFLFAVSGASSRIFVGERVVSTLKLEPKSHNKKLVNLKGEEHKFRNGGEFPTVNIPSIQIGGLELKDVLALTSPDDDDDTPYASDDSPSPDVLDGTIGMGALHELGYAISLSKGVVRFSPAGRAGELLADVGGPVTPWSTKESAWLKFGSEKSWSSPLDLVVQAQVGNQPATVWLNLLGPSYLDSTKIYQDGALVLHRGDQAAVLLPVQVGGVNLGTQAWTDADTSKELVASVPDAQSGVDGAIGTGHLRGVDLAVDPAGTLSLKVVASARRADPLPILREAAEAALKDSIEGKGDDDKEGDKDKEAVTADASKPKGDVAAYKRAADLAEASGDFKRAVELRQTIIAFDERDCTGWNSLGRAQYDNNDVQGALTSLKSASDLSHAWWDLSFDARRDLGKQIDKKGADKDALAPRQSPACHQADGDLAVALLAAGLYDALEALYRGKLDLDGRVATAYAVSSILSGKATAAQEPYRQAQKLERSPSVFNRLGLGLAYEAAGDSATALGHFERAAELLPGGPGTVQLWLAAVARASGPDAAAKAGRDFLAEHPTSAAAWFAAAWAVSQADSAALAGLQAKGDQYFSSELGLNPPSAGLLSTYARYLVVTGRVDAAREAATKALVLAPASAMAWLALADVETAAGDATKATAALKRAGQANALHPAYAQGLGTH